MDEINKFVHFLANNVVVLNLFVSQLYKFEKFLNPLMNKENITKNQDGHTDIRYSSYRKAALLERKEKQDFKMARQIHSR